MKILIAIIALIIALIAFTNPGRSQEVCMPRAQALAIIGQANQKPVLYGITTENNTIIELYENQDTDHWTLIYTNTNTNISCLVVQGTNLRFHKEHIPSY